MNTTYQAPTNGNERYAAFRVSDADLAAALAEVETIRYCAICGEPEGSEYAKRCCTDDQMIED